jgi:hypothetical protein
MFIGMIIMAGIVVVADNLSASEVDYKETNVESALDTLYQRSTYTEYDGNTTITPSSTSQTLPTNNKLLKSDITIDAIPSTFMELAQTTTVTADKLLSGETAYNNLGELITGSMTNGCVNGSFVCTTCTTSSGQLIVNFNPSVFVLYTNVQENGNSIDVTYYYNRSINSTKVINANSSPKYIWLDFSQKFSINSQNQLLAVNAGTTWQNKTVRYLACR